MKLPLQISFEGMQRSEAVEAVVREKLHHLERFSGEIMSCRVVIDLLQKHRHQGRPFGVRIALTIPGRELLVNRVENVDVYVALRDAVDDMRRQLEDAVRQRRGQEKHHVDASTGRVSESNDGA